MYLPFFTLKIITNLREKRACQKQSFNNFDSPTSCLSHLIECLKEHKKIKTIVFAVLPFKQMNVFTFFFTLKITTNPGREGHVKNKVSNIFDFFFLHFLPMPFEDHSSR